MDARRLYFIGNRIWWASALIGGPVAGAITGDIVVTLFVSLLVVLPSFVLFDTDRPWWPDDVHQLPHDPARMRSETRALTLWSGIALAAGGSPGGLPASERAISPMVEAGQERSLGAGPHGDARFACGKAVITR
jgi:hypothetical protein